MRVTIQHLFAATAMVAIIFQSARLYHQCSTLTGEIHRMNRSVDPDRKFDERRLELFTDGTAALEQELKFLQTVPAMRESRELIGENTRDVSN